MSWLISRGWFLVSIRINRSDYIQQFGTGTNTNYNTEVNRFRNHKKKTIGWHLHSLWLTQPMKREKKKEEMYLHHRLRGYIHTHSILTHSSVVLVDDCFFFRSFAAIVFQLVSSRWSISFSLCTWTQNNECIYRSNGERFEQFHVNKHAKRPTKIMPRFLVLVFLFLFFFFDK